MADPTAPERNQRARERVRGSGGAVCTVMLSAAAQRALRRLSVGMTKREAIERALLAASPPELGEDTAGWLDVATRGR